MGSLQEQFLIRRGDVWYFRRVFPNHIRTRLQKREIKLSLQTQSRDIARRRCRALANAYEVLVERWWQMAELPDDVINKVVKDYFIETMLTLKDAVELGAIKPFPAFDVKEERQRVASEMDNQSEELVTGTYSGWTEAWAGQALKKAGIEPPEKWRDSWETLQRFILRAQKESNRIYLAMLNGQYDEVQPKDPMFSGLDVTTLGALNPGGASSATNADASNQNPSQIAVTCKSSPPLSELVTKYIALKSTSWSDKTKLDNMRVLSWLKELIGDDLPISQLSKDHVAQYRDLMMGMPKNMAKNPKYSGMNLQQAVKACDEGEQIALKTADKYLNMMRYFLKWCVEEEHIDAVPGANMKLPKVKSTKKDRDPFSPEQLKTLFSSPVYVGCASSHRRSIPGDQIIKDGLYWLPLIALYSGMRMAEIAQLHIADVKQEDGIWFFDVTSEQNGDVPGPPKSFKSIQSIRKVPVHSKLQDAGFLKHVADCKANPLHGPRIFPDIKPTSKWNYSTNFSKTFGRYRNNIGVTANRVCFHSFRHNFKEALDDAEIEEKHQKALMGHAEKSEAHSKYSSGIKIGILAKKIEKISYKSII